MPRATTPAHAARCCKIACRSFAIPSAPQLAPTTIVTAPCALEYNSTAVLRVDLPPEPVVTSRITDRHHILWRKAWCLLTLESNAVYRNDRHPVQPHAGISNPVVTVIGSLHTMLESWLLCSCVTDTLGGRCDHGTRWERIHWSEQKAAA